MDKLISCYVKVRNALHNKKGQGMVEYALIIALVAVVLAASLESLEGGIAGVFTDIVEKLNGTT